jgi:hypothetical protein
MLSFRPVTLRPPLSVKVAFVGEPEPFDLLIGAQVDAL